MKITANYSENLPGDQYKTRRWSVELSLEIPDNQDPSAATAQLFGVASACVKSQVEQAKALGSFSGNGNGNGNGNGHHTATPAPMNQHPINGNGNSRMASEKQIKYLFQLAKRNGSMSDEQIRGLPAQYFGKKSLSELTSKEASQIIDVFAEQRKAA